MASTSNDGVAAAGGRLISTLLRLIVLGICVAVLVLIFLPATNFADSGNFSEDGVRSVRSQLIQLRDATGMDQAFSGTLSEADLNAYLYDVVHNRNQTRAGLKPESLLVNFEDGSIDVAVLSRVGFLPVSYRMTMEPQNVEDGSFTSKVTSASIGRLPLPGPLANMVRQKFETMFSGMPSETELFEKLDYLEPQTDKLAFKTNAGSGA